MLPDQSDRQDDHHRLQPPAWPPPSLFSGKGLFTTTDAGSASDLHSDWVAVQKDPEGDPSTLFNNNPGRLCYWQARPTQAVVDQAREREIPYIGQAENQDELDRCLDLNTGGLVTKAIVGNAGSWTDIGARRAASQGWNLIQEWYANAHPWEKAPDANHYPHFVNVCFGIYSEGEEGGDGYVEQIPLESYRQVWTGSFSVWKAEAMTDADRAAYNR